jgi:hypothetical protein
MVLLLMWHPSLPLHPWVGKYHRHRNRVVEGDTDQPCRFLSDPISSKGLCRATSRAFLSFIIQYNDVESQERHKESDSARLCTPITSSCTGWYSCHKVWINPDEMPKVKNLDEKTPVTRIVRAFCMKHQGIGERCGSNGGSSSSWGWRCYGCYGGSIGDGFGGGGGRPRINCRGIGSRKVQQIARCVV